MKHCPLCQNDNLNRLFKITDVPVYCNVLYEDPYEAAKSATGTISLEHCPQCDLVFNSGFRSDLIAYDVNYDASLDSSEHFQNYMTDLANDLLSRHQLTGKNVIEIACGKGGFLKCLSELADNNYVGFDPSFDQSTNLSDNINIITAYFNADTIAEHVVGNTIDLLICRHALEHFPDPLAFLTTLRSVISHQDDCKVYFEVPNSLFMLRDLSVWDFIYEHISYFSPYALNVILNKAGFYLDECSENYGGQYLSAHGSLVDSHLFALEGLARNADYIHRLKASFTKIISYWNHFLSNSTGITILWGAGSKGITFLNSIAQPEKITAIVDLNKNKQGKYTPGSCHQIISPDQLIKYKPKCIVIMNAIYKDEIEHMLKYLDIECDVLVVTDHG